MPLSSLKFGNKILSFKSEMQRITSSFAKKLEQPELITANDFNTFAEELNETLERMVNFIPSIIKECKKADRPEVESFLNEILDLPDLEYRNKPVYVIAHRAKLYKKLVKILVKENDMCSKDSITKSASHAITRFLKLANMCNMDKNHDLAQYYANSAVECSEYIEPSPIFLSEFPSLATIRDLTLATANFTSHLALTSKGHTANFTYLKKCLQHTRHVDNNLFAECDAALKTLFSQHNHWELLDLFSKLPKRQEPSSSNEHRASNELITLLQKNHILNIVAAKKVLIEEYKTFFEQIHLPGLTLSFNNNELRLAFDESVPFNKQAITPLMTSLESKGLTISEHQNAIVMSNVTSHPLATLNKHIKAAYKRITQESANIMQTQDFPKLTEHEIADITPVESYAYSTSSTSASTCNLPANTSIRVKVKTRAAVAAPAVAATSESDGSDEEISTLTKGMLGFKMDGSEADEPVYELKGPNIIPGVYFVYKDLSSIRCSHLSENLIERHERLIREGHVVAPGKQGLRLTRVDDATAFKTTIPNHDARIILTVEQKHTTDEGKEIFLYRPSSVRLHNQNKRNRK